MDNIWKRTWKAGIKLITDLLKSKKFMASLASMLVGLAAKVELDLDVQEITAILSPAIAYILGQGIADHGKEAEKVKKENQATG